MSSRRALVVAVAAAAAAAAATAAASLRDAAIATTSPPLYLDGPAWTAAEASLALSIAATVPGDVISDLQRAGVIGDPYFERAWIENRTLWDVSATAWTYTSAGVPLPPPAAPDGATLLLVLDGVKMGARVALNGVALGDATNQFLRYVFALPPGAVRGAAADNRVSVAFDASLPLSGRFMPCSGLWDWAPNSQLVRNDSDFGPAATFSSGIVGSVYVAAVAPATVALLHVVPLVRYLGPYPVGALSDGTHAGFSVNVTVHVWAPPGGASGSFAVVGDWPGADASTPVVFSPAGESHVSLTLAAPASAISLWWPSGLGTQSLFDVNVTWTPAAAAVEAPTAPSAAPAAPAAAASTAATAAAAAVAATAAATTAATAAVSASRRIGFRVAALVTVNDTNATVVEESKGADGSGQFGMFLRVNGAALYARGADLVPMEELEGRQSAGAYATLVDSAADAHMNALRIWGGGTYLPQTFYDRCDERGVLLYHDMIFSGAMGHGIESARQPLSAAANASILAEIAHQVRRLSHHPAIVLYDGANEVIVERSGPSSLYASLVMSAVAAEELSRRRSPSAPRTRFPMRGAATRRYRASQRKEYQ